LPADRAAAVNHVIGAGYFVDSATGNLYPVLAYLAGTNTMGFIRTTVETTASFLGSSGLTQLTSGDTGSISFSYEASS
jgi:hypothetical protein